MLRKGWANGLDKIIRFCERSSLSYIGRSGDKEPFINQLLNERLQQPKFREEFSATECLQHPCISALKRQGLGDIIIYIYIYIFSIECY